MNTSAVPPVPPASPIPPLKPTSAGKRYVFVVSPVYRRNFMLGLVCSLILVSVYYAIYFYFFRDFRATSVIAPLWVLIAIIAYVIVRIQRIEIGPDGFSQSGFSLWPKHTPWEQMLLVRHMNHGKLAQWGSEGYYFRPLYGNDFVLYYRRGKSDVFTGEGHTLSLGQALSIFLGDIPELSEEERQKIPALRYTIDLGKKVGHVAWGALGAVILTIGMLFVNSLWPLDFPDRTFLYWTVAAIAFVLSLVYMRKSCTAFFPLIIAGLLASLGAFCLTFSLLNGLIRIWAEPVPVTFAIADENEHKQVWRAVDDPTLQLTIEEPIKARRHEGIGTEQVLNVYRGPLGMGAILKRDCDAQIVYTYSNY